MITTKGQQWLEAAAVFGTGLVAGFTFYISKIEIPSRANDTGAYNLANYQRVFPPSAAFMKPCGLLLTGLLGGVVYNTMAKTRSKKLLLLWSIPLICIGSLGPFTSLVISDTNEKLMKMKPMELRTPDDDAKAKYLVSKWGKLHHVRTGLSFIAFATTIIASLRV
mmetsp:Transcript_27307/g.31170  ORF Transcript_27307/g.31170 Transcript_27307/m.31170 type:complete len:165 (-) Transcript_27307:64-558(-)